MPDKNDPLFIIEKIEHQDGIISARMGINKNCAIFDGHFPGHPVVPGACMLQIVKDILEEVLNTSLRLKKADNLKFMAMIDPGITPGVDLDLTYSLVEDSFNVTAKLMNGDIVCFKFQGRFVR